MKKEKISSNRSFGVVFFIFFLIISIYPIFNGLKINIYFLLISLIFLALGLLNSRLLYPLNFLWNKLGVYLGILVSPLIMGIMYFAVVFPTSLILSILGKDILKLRKNNEKSYWSYRENKITKTNMDNQF